MKKTKTFLIAGMLSVIGLIAIAADHIDAPAVQGTTADITDYYAFEGATSSNMVFVANVQGLIAPTETAVASFDENVLVEFNIDTDNDFVEDLIIQAIPRDGKMYFFGPVASGTTTAILSNASINGVVDITSYGSNAVTATNSSEMKFFAGPRDDPFFMDFARYGEIIAGNATSFNSPGADTFAGTNVMSIVVEVPKSLIGGSGSINTWVEAKRKQ
jgi:hypothetical protein